MSFSVCGQEILDQREAEIRKNLSEVTGLNFYCPGFDTDEVCSERLTGLLRKVTELGSDAFDDYKELDDVHIRLGEEFSPHLKMNKIGFIDVDKDILISLGSIKNQYQTYLDNVESLAALGQGEVSFICGDIKIVKVCEELIREYRLNAFDLSFLDFIGSSPVEVISLHSITGLIQPTLREKTLYINVNELSEVGLQSTVRQMLSTPRSLNE